MRTPSLRTAGSVVSLLLAAILAGCATVLPDQSSAPSFYKLESVAYSPDGRHIAAATGASDAVFLFDAATGKPLSYMRGKDVASAMRPLRAPALAFSHDGRWLASSSWRDSIAIRIWDVGRRSEIRQIPGPPDALRVAFAPDDNRIGTAGPGNEATIWDAASGQIVTKLGGHQAAVLDVAFSPDGRLAATADADGSLRIYDASSYEVLKVIPGHSGPATGIAFSPDGQLLVSSAGGYDIRLWAANTGEAVKTLTDLEDQIRKRQPREAALSALFFIAGVRGIQLVGAPTPAMAAAATPIRVPICATRVAFSPDGKRVAAVIDRVELSFNSRFHLFVMELETGTAHEVDDYHGCDIAFSPEGSRVAGGDVNGVSIYDIDAKKLIR